MDSVVDALPFTATVARALVDRAGPLGEMLECVLAYERADFEAVAAFGIPVDVADTAYRRAIPWADIASGNLI